MELISTNWLYINWLCCHSNFSSTCHILIIPYVQTYYDLILLWRYDDVDYDDDDDEKTDDPTDWFWYLNLDFKIRKTFLSKLYELLSMNGGKIFIKRQLEILTMDSNCCLSASSYWIYKIFQLSGKSAKSS